MDAVKKKEKITTKVDAITASGCAIRESHHAYSKGFHFVSGKILVQPSKLDANLLF